MFYQALRQTHKQHIASSQLYLRASQSHWHFHWNTFAIINRANFFLLRLIMEWKIALLSHTLKRSLNWLSSTHQLTLLSRPTERSMWSLYNLAEEQLWNGVIGVFSNEQCESDTLVSLLLICVIEKRWGSATKLEHKRWNLTHLLKLMRQLLFSNFVFSFHHVVSTELYCSTLFQCLLLFD